MVIPVGSPGAQKYSWYRVLKTETERFGMIEKDRSFIVLTLLF